MIGKILGSLLIYFLSVDAFCGVVTGTLDKSEGTSDEQFYYTLSIEGKLSAQPNFPKVSGLEVVGTQTSQQTRIINGNFSRELQLIYSLQVASPGTYNIPAIEVEVDGKIERTLPLSLKVRQLSMAQRRARPMYGIQTIDKRILYQGEAASLNVKLFSRYRLEQDPEFRAPTSPDLRLQELNKLPNTKKVVGGHEYIVGEGNFLLVPDKAGTITVPPVQAIAHIASELGFLRRIQSKIIEPNTLEIQVKPLPQKGRSKDFSGLVGQFIVMTDVPKREVKVGDNVVVSFRVEGYGEVMSMAEPELSFIDKDAMKVYKDKAVHESELKNNRYYSSKTFNYAIVPRREGDFPLGKIEIQYFDPIDEGYKKLFADLGSIRVAKGSNLSNPVSPTLQGAKPPSQEKVDIKILGQDILGLHHRSRLESNSQLSSYQFYLGLFLILASIGVPLVSWYWSQSLEVDDRREMKRRYQAAYKMFAQAQKDIEAMISKDPTQGVLQIQDQLRIYLGHKFNVRGLALTEKDVQEQLEKVGVSRDMTAKALQLFRDLDRIRYTNQVPTDPQNFLTRTVDLVSKLEKQC